MAGPANHEQMIVPPALEEQRLLTEVDNLLAVMDTYGHVPVETLHDERLNLQTGIYEMAIPTGVTTTIHPVEYRETGADGRERMFKWMGKNLVQAAMGGRQFHRAAAAHERVDVEIDEAGFTQERLRPDVAQALISPKMSARDAPEHIAKAEHLHADDSVRVSYAVTNSRGEVVGRRLESLLVRDVPLEAWVAMLKDPHNIFGKAFDIDNEQSALSVMKLFREMELAEELLPEGPITLVAEVQKYIKDNEAYDSVGRQLEGFRQDQALYKYQAELAAQEWLEFELELAKSLKSGSATGAVRGFIMSLQHHWNDAQLAVIENHNVGDTRYIMTRQLAAILERAKRNLVASKAAIATNNEAVLSQLHSGNGRLLHDRIRSLQMMYANRLISEQEYAREQAMLNRELASHNIQGGGGCEGDMAADFRQYLDNDPSSNGRRDDQASGWERGNRKWKIGTCQVKACPSPKPTEVGPCSVCKHCQAIFDAGGDPTKPGFFAGPAKKEEESFQPHFGWSEAEEAMAEQVDEAFAEVEGQVMDLEPDRHRGREVAQIALRGAV